MTIRYSKASVKYLATLDKKTRNRILKAIEGLSLNPPVGDIKPLQGYQDNRFRLRVGGYRVLYRVILGDVEILLVLDIGSRGDIYK